MGEIGSKLLYLEQTVPLAMNAEQTLNTTNANKDFISSNDRGAQGLLSTVNNDMLRAFLLIIGRAVNTFDGQNWLDCSTATWNQWMINLDGGGYTDLVNGSEPDGQMLDTDWDCEALAVIHPFTLMFDITSQLTNVDGNIGVRLANGCAEEASLVVTCDIYLKIIWKK